MSNLVTHDDPAQIEVLVPAQAELPSIQTARNLVDSPIRPRCVGRAPAVDNLQIQSDLGTVKVEATPNDRVGTVEPDLRALECGPRKTRDIEELRRADVLIALSASGVDAGQVDPDPDAGLRRIDLVEVDGSTQRAKEPLDLADDDVPQGETKARMLGIDAPVVTRSFASEPPSVSRPGAFVSFAPPLPQAVASPRGRGAAPRAGHERVAGR